MKTWTWVRKALVLTDAFAAASAIAGGLALIRGLIKFPDSWLPAAPWSWLVSGYFVPGAILFLVVGGTALAATIATIYKPTMGAGFSAAAGLVMGGWIVGEVAILAQYTWLQPFYGAVGLAMIALGVALEPEPLQVMARRLHLIRPTTS